VISLFLMASLMTLPAFWVRGIYLICFSDESDEIAVEEGKGAFILAQLGLAIFPSIGVLHDTNILVDVDYRHFQVLHVTVQPFPAA
jgi:hypothetical protein